MQLNSVLVSAFLLFFTFAAPASVQAVGRAKYFVLVVWDGMRPDFVSPELTPTLCSLRSNGVWFANHHSVFPQRPR
jgi:predicted AlkP superfamily pyrophosphatase or phosphodiesterase